MYGEISSTIQTRKGKNMIKNIRKDEMIACVNCYKLLKECVCFENIENRELICNKLNEIRAYRSHMSAELYSRLEEFIEDVIKPIVFDADYFSFLRKEEFGSLDKDGHFVINSESSLENIIFLMYHHTLDLNQKVDEFASNSLKLKL